MTDEISFAEAVDLVSQCDTWDEFQEKHQDAYFTACRRLWVDELVGLCKDTRFAWTPESLANEAKKHASRAEFVRESPGAYITARDLNILDEICQHMAE